MKNKLGNIFNEVACSHPRLSLFLPTIVVIAASASSGCLEQVSSFDFDSFIDSISNTVDPDLDSIANLEITKTVTTIDSVSVDPDAFSKIPQQDIGIFNNAVNQAANGDLISTQWINVYNPDNQTEVLFQMPVDFDGRDGAAYDDIVSGALKDYNQKLTAILDIKEEITGSDNFETFVDTVNQVTLQSRSHDFTSNQWMNVPDPNNTSEVLCEIPVKVYGANDATYNKIVEGAINDYNEKVEAVQYAAEKLTDTNFDTFIDCCNQAANYDRIVSFNMDVYNPNDPTKVLFQIPVEFDGSNNVDYTKIVKNALDDYNEKSSAILQAIGNTPKQTGPSM
ncbi:MAG: hypothetical protein KAI61_01635 [Alphaproteobacteria bacterium]|nr:hypothetical protein [Alphaproteobacteria bacterium]MCK5658433.1 hypothetical protein [Alphaproteobacteria bacterium]